MSDGRPPLPGGFPGGRPPMPPISSGNPFGRRPGALPRSHPGLAGGNARYVPGMVGTITTDPIEDEDEDWVCDEADDPEEKSTTTKKRRDYRILPWQDFWDRKEQLTLHGNDKFTVYYKDPINSSGVSPQRKPPRFFLVHGGGHSALGWSVLVKELQRCLPDGEFVAADLRGHGTTQCEDEEDLSRDHLVDDLEEILGLTYPPTQEELDHKREEEERRQRKEMPKPSNFVAQPIIAIGHSMGGGLVAELAARDQDPSKRRLAAVILLDVVEGTALESLSKMGQFVRSRPPRFRTVEDAVAWAHRSGQVRNLHSARISIPAQLKAVGSKLSVTSDDIESKANDNDTNDGNGYEWRVDLMSTEPFWRGWFEGMTEKFLKGHCLKLLVIAGVDRMDKELTIAQMQGKYQLEILPECGHCVQEDAPKRIAGVLTRFIERNRIGQPMRAGGIPGLNRPGPAVPLNPIVQ
eukprot:Clim_evm10s223 gene=Clim_evmTU10s223